MGDRAIMDHVRDEVLEAVDLSALREIALVRIDRSGKIRSASAAAAAMLGYSPQELSGRDLVALAAIGGGAAIQAAIGRLTFDCNESFHLQLQGRSGRRTSIRLVLRRVVESRSDDVEFITEWEETRGYAGPDLAGGDARPECKRFAYGLLSGQEAERLRVTSELHGAVAPLILTAKITLEGAMQRLASGDADNSLESMKAASLQLRDALGELGKISSELRPSLLDDLGLIPTIDWFCRQFEVGYRTLRVERVIDVREQQVPDHLKLEIFRIIQEAMSNVARHSRATRARIALMIAEDELIVTVDDDGIGFHADELFYGSTCLLGIGLLTLEKRIAATGGRLLLDSVPGRGTLIGAAWKIGEAQSGPAADR